MRSKQQGGNRAGIAGFFDRVVVINLKRRPERLTRLWEKLRQCQWPFRWPEVFEAIDGRVAPHPQNWQSGSGAWGCMKSHQLVLEQAVKDGVGNVLVLEDDVCFAENFRGEVEHFINAVPKAWDQIMLGGQHFSRHGRPRMVKPGVYRCYSCERMHCYAVRGEFMRKFHERLLGGGKFNGAVHCDWILGRDPELQRTHKVYAPPFFLAGQERGQSDINGQKWPSRFWNPPGPHLPVINLHASPEVLTALREHGVYTGDNRDPETDIDVTLLKIFQKTEDRPKERIELLADWIKIIQGRVASEPHLICTVWHPQAIPEVVKAASLWRVYEITADNVDDALCQLSRKLRKTLPPAPREL
jgi:hypothetical protein